MKTILKVIFFGFIGLFILGSILPDSTSTKSSPSVTPIEYPKGVLESAAAELDSNSPIPEPFSSETSSMCEPVSKEVMAAIVIGADEGTGMKAIRAIAYRSPDFTKVYFVAMEFSATGVPNQVGVWATNSITEVAAIMSTEGYSKNFTDWPDASKTDAQISGTDRSIKIAKDCLSQQ